MSPWGGRIDIIIFNALPRGPLRGGAKDNMIFNVSPPEVGHIEDNIVYAPPSAPVGEGALKIIMFMSPPPQGGTTLAHDVDKREIFRRCGFFDASGLHDVEECETFRFFDVS